MTCPLFLFATLVFSGNSLRRSVVVEFSAEGLIDKRKKGPLIPWTAIGHVSTITASGISFLSVDPLTAFEPTIRPRESAGSISVSFLGLEPGLDEALKFIAGVDRKLVAK